MARLGLDSFLGTSAGDHDRTDMRYDPRPLPHLTFPR
jgi:hypothetical protein